MHTACIWQWKLLLSAVFSSSVDRNISLQRDSREWSSCVVLSWKSSSAAVSVGQWVTSLQTACRKPWLSNVRIRLYVWLCPLNNTNVVVAKQMFQIKVSEKIETEKGNRRDNVCSNVFKTPQMSQNHINSKNYVSSFQRMTEVWSWKVAGRNSHQLLGTTDSLSMCYVSITSVKVTSGMRWQWPCTGKSNSQHIF